MARSIENVPAELPVVDELEKYQQLVELQKQIIALAQQNERAEQACSALREQMASEVVSHASSQKIYDGKQRAICEHCRDYLWQNLIGLH